VGADAALRGFREALRLDPTDEMARAGLVDAMKARNPLYALLLRYTLWSSRLGGRATILLFVGFILASRLGRGLARDPQLSWLGFALVGVLLLFVWTTYAGNPLFNLLLRLDPLGRHALDDDQRTEANLVGTLVAIGLPAAVAAIVLQAMPAIAVAVATLGGVVPAALAFRVTGPWRAALAALTGGVLVLGAAAAFLAAADPSAGDAPQLLTFVAFALVIVSTWASIPLALRHRAR